MPTGPHTGSAAGVKQRTTWTSAPLRTRDCTHERAGMPHTRRRGWTRGTHSCQGRQPAPKTCPHLAKLQDPSLLSPYSDSSPSAKGAPVSMSRPASRACPAISAASSRSSRASMSLHPQRNGAQAPNTHTEHIRHTGHTGQTSHHSTHTRKHTQPNASARGNNRMPAHARLTHSKTPHKRPSSAKESWGFPPTSAHKPLRRAKRSTHSASSRLSWRACITGRPSPSVTATTSPAQNGHAHDFDMSANTLQRPAPI